MILGEGMSSVLALVIVLLLGCSDQRLAGERSAGPSTGRLEVPSERREPEGPEFPAGRMSVAWEFEEEAGLSFTPLYDPALHGSVDFLEPPEGRGGGELGEGGSRAIMIQVPGKVANVEFDQKGIARFSLNDPVNPYTPDGNLGEEYTLVVFNVGTAAGLHFELFGIDDFSAPLPSGALRLPAPEQQERTSSLTTGEEAMNLIENGHLQQPYRSRALSVTTLAIGNELAFKVRTDVGRAKAVSTVLQALGKYVAIYVDKDVPLDIPDPADPSRDLDNRGLPLPDVPVPFSAGFSRAHLRRIAKIFDNNIYPLETSIYGKPPNIDGDQRISVLISPVVNGLRGPSGVLIKAFVNEQDLLPYDPIDNPTSNEQEVIYVHAPDPCGFYFPQKRVDTLSYSLTTLPAQLALQLQKLISFNQHVLVNKGAEEEEWIDNGLGLLAADYAGFGGILYADLKLSFFDAPFHDFNALRGGSTVDNRGDFNDAQQYLFFKYLADRFGTPLFKDLFGVKTGVANIESAVASILPGMTFEEILRDFSVALAISDTELVNAEDLDRFQFKPPLPSNRYGTVGFQTGIRVRGLNGSRDGDGVYDAFEDRNGNGIYETFGTDGVVGTLDDELDPTRSDTDGDGFDDGFELQDMIDSDDYCRSLDMNANYLDFSRAKNAALKPTSSAWSFLTTNAVPPNYLGLSRYPGQWVYWDEYVGEYGDSRGFHILYDEDRDGLPSYQESALWINPTCATLLNGDGCATPRLLPENADRDPSLVSITWNLENIETALERTLRRVRYGTAEEPLEDLNDNYQNDLVLDLDHNGRIDPLEYVYLTILHEDRNGDGICDTSSPFPDQWPEDRNANGRCDFGIDFDGNGILVKAEIINTGDASIAKARFIREADCLADLGYPAGYTPTSGVQGDLNNNGRNDDLIFDLNANGICDAGEDKDGNGLPSDITTIAATGMDGNAATLFDNETDIGREDGDGDGYPDGVEFRFGANPNDRLHALVDSDGDGLPDIHELELYGTNPTKPDTDGDGYDDNTELAAGTSPGMATDHPGKGRGEKVYTGTLTFRLVGAQVLDGPKEDSFVAGEPFLGYVAPFGIRYVRMTGLGEFQSNFILRDLSGAKTSIRAVLIKRNPLCADEDGCTIVIGPDNTTRLVPYNPQRTFIEAKFGSLFQFPNTDRSLPPGERTGINAIDLGDGQVTFLGRIDEPVAVKVKDKDLAEESTYREVWDVDKYVVDLPPLTRLAVWVERRLDFISPEEPPLATLNPLLMVARYQDVPMHGVPEDLRSGVAVPPFPAANRPIISVPDPGLGPLQQYPQALSFHDYNLRFMHPGFELPEANDIDLTDGDADLDGIPNEQEVFELGTDPRDPDTDGDGFDDYHEGTAQTDPKDPASNPRENGRENDSNSKADSLEVPIPIEDSVPPDVDLDEDFLLYSDEDLNENGIRDLGETCPDRFVVGCQEVNPKDTDGDRYSDGFERAFGTDPNNPSSVPKDLDEDSLPNCLEEPLDYPRDDQVCLDNPNAGGGDKVVGTYDDVIDASLFDYDPERGETSAIFADSDYDGIPDGTEYWGSLIVLGDVAGGRTVRVFTDPLEHDTDGDGFCDGKEVAAKSDPTSIPSMHSPLEIDLRRKDGTPLTLPSLPTTSLGIYESTATMAGAAVMEQIRDCLRDPFIDDPKQCGVFEPKLDIDEDTNDDDASYSIELVNGLGGQSSNDDAENALHIRDVVYGGRFLLMVGGEGESTGPYVLHIKMLPHHTFRYGLQWHQIKRVGQ